jgi:hypothetical protein
VANFDFIVNDRIYLPGTGGSTQPYVAVAAKYYGANDLGANQAWLGFAGVGLSSTPSAKGLVLTGQGGLNAGLLDGGFTFGLEAGAGIKYGF